jgi:hypothetical protein
LFKAKSFERSFNRFFRGRVGYRIFGSKEGSWIPILAFLRLSISS